MVLYFCGVGGGRGRRRYRQTDIDTDTDTRTQARAALCFVCACARVCFSFVQVCTHFIQDAKAANFNIDAGMDATHCSTAFESHTVVSLGLACQANQSPFSVPALFFSLSSAEFDEKLTQQLVDMASEKDANVQPHRKTHVFCFVWLCVPVCVPVCGCAHTCTYACAFSRPPHLSLFPLLFLPSPSPNRAVRSDMSKPTRPPPPPPKGVTVRSAASSASGGDDNGDGRGDDKGDGREGPEHDTTSRRGGRDEGPEVKLVPDLIVPGGNLRDRADTITV